MMRFLVLAAACCAAAGCGTFTDIRLAQPPPPQTHVVTMDGTANDFESRTNAAKLHFLLADHPDEAVGTFYIEGVGAKDKWVGAATGLGFGDRVRAAYAHLLQSYQAGDDIYLFGFSRGAYSARVLASLVHYGGLPSQPIDDPGRASQVAKAIFEAYKGEHLGHAQRSARIAAARAAIGVDTFASRPIRFMGLWDTVESMGAPDGREHVDGENPNYADQLCNVQRAAHAMSLDDNRALDFTPVLLTRPHLLKDCDTTAWGEPWSYSLDKAYARLDQTVDEVWFAGAHADVGGGYPDARLSGVSLNWMLSHLKQQGLIDGYQVRLENHTQRINDPQAAFLKGKVYRRQWRDLEDYASDSRYNGRKLKVHPTVFSRLSALKVDGPRSTAGLATDKFQDCFRAVGTDRHVFDPKPTCLLSRASLPE